MDLIKSRSSPTFQFFTPISKNLKPNQVYSDYKHQILSTAKIIMSSSSALMQNAKTEEEFKFVRKGNKLFTSTAIEKALEERKNLKIKKKDSSAQKDFDFFSSKKPRIVEYIPYSIKDFKELEIPQITGGLGSARIGSIKWENEKKKLQRTKLYSDSVKKKTLL